MTDALVKSLGEGKNPDGEWDPYVILGVHPRASINQIRASYRRHAKQTHSDVEGGNVDSFLRLKEAHDFLLDPISRALWDRKQVRVTDGMRQVASERLKLLADQIIMSLIDGPISPEHVHLPAELKKVLIDHIHSMERRLSEVKSRKKRLRLMSGRTERTGPGDNLIEAAIERKAAEHAAAEQQITDELITCELMTAEIAQYRSDLPEPAPHNPDPWGSSLSGSSAMTQSTFWRGV